MKKIKGLFFLAFIIWAAMFIMTACGGGTDENGEPTPSAPGAPTIEDIYAENRELAILWDAVSNANTFNLYWNTTGGVTTSDTSVPNLRTTYYVHSGLSLFKTYSYRVSAVNAGGSSGLSNEMSALAANIPEELWKRTAVDKADDDWFGHSVALSGDYAVVGAPIEDGTGTNWGAAYIFALDSGGTNNWGQAKKLSASDAADNDYFGGSVSINGDYVVVGAYYEDGAGINRGAVYIFSRNQGGTNNWGEVAKLIASDPENVDYFGYSVAISGDTVVVGAPGEDGLGTNRGAAYVFDRNEGGTDNWGEVAKLTASDPEDDDDFGFSVALSGDTVVVGSVYEDGLGINRGAAYIFDRDEGGTDNWGEVVKLTASDPEDSDWFGHSVTINGDYVMVGASLEDGTGTNRGSVYIFDRNYGGADNWGEVAKLIASDAEDGDEFGGSMAIDGDYLIVGAHYEDGAGTSRGAAYIFGRNYGGADTWGEVMKLTALDAEDQDWFGFSVAINGDYAVVGAHYEDGAGSNRGAIYIF